MRPFRIVTTVFLLGFCAAFGSALDPAKSPKEYVHRIWQVENGLPQGSVTGLTQSSDGFLWLSTFGGLARFNGSQFFTLPPNVKGPGPRINFLTAAPGGALWVGGEFGGLWKYIPSSGDWVREEALGDKRITAILDDSDGSTWIGTERDGLLRLVGTRLEKLIGSLPSSHIVALCRDGGNSLWVGTTSGLVRVQGQSFQVFTQDDGLPSNTISSLVVSKKGDLFVGTASPAGVSLWRNGGFSVVINDAELAHVTPINLLEDRDGNLWIATFGRGLVRWSNNKSARFDTTDGLSDGAVRTLFEDLEGNLWVGTNAGGLNLLRDTIFQVISSKEGLIPDHPLAVMEDTDGSILAGLNCGGVMRVSGRGAARERTTGELANACVWSLLRAHDGALWVGTWGEGVFRFFNGRRSDFARASPLEDKVVLALFEDRQGGVWVGTREAGATRFFNGIADRKVRKSDGLPASDVRSIAEDRKGNLFFATSGGLSRLDSRGLFTYTTTSGLSVNYLRALYVDADDNLWIGTYGGGLAVVVNDKVVSLTSRDGLFDDVVSWIGEDRLGHLWLSGNRGVFKFRRHDLLNRAKGSGEKIYPVVYGKEDGLKTVECAGGFQPAGVVARDGKIWIPTLQGLAVIDPQRLPSRQARRAILDRFLVDGEPVALKATIDLPARRHNVEFHFTSLDLVALDKVIFRYRLDGFDTDWIKASPARVASYGSLPPGDYVFVVQASSPEGGWGPASSPVTIRLPEPFWSAWWFRFSLPILLAVFVFALGRWQRLSRTRQELDRIKLAHETVVSVLVALRQPLQVIRARLDMIERRGRDANVNLRVEDALEAVDRIQHLLGRAEQVHGAYESEPLLISRDVDSPGHDRKDAS